MTQALTVLNTDIRIHDGLYSLNDLHKASGAEEKHAPNRWLRIDQTKALIAEIEQTPDLAFAPVKSVRGGPGGSGTYACKELVYAYAMWISAKFHLAVIRAFDALVSGQAPALPEPPTITKAQAGELAALVAERAGETGKNRAYYWSRFNHHFRLARYRDLPAEKFDEAVEYIRTMPDEQGNKPALLGTLTATGGRLTVLMTIEGDRITHMQPLGEGEVVIDPAKLPENIHAILPGWRAVPMRDLDTLTRLALASLELFDGIETMKGKLRETAEKMRHLWVN